MLVKTVQEVPEKLKGKDRLEFDRTCTVECAECGKVITDQPYD